MGRTSRSTTRQHDDLFLARVAESTPALAGDVELVRHALVHPVNTPQFIEVGNAIARIETTLTRT